MIERALSDKLIDISTHFPVVALLGPRQSGKTTLAKKMFPDHKYITLEDLDFRREAQEDPRGFLHVYVQQSGIILDEFQHVPELLSYIQTFVDEDRVPGKFILTGSQNFLMNEAITQSLAGRVGILTLLPLSTNELITAHKLPASIDDAMVNGCYPAHYAHNTPPTYLYPNYITSYIERDVRSIKNISNLTLFQKFMGLCAGRIGQILNLSSLANDCGISVPTAKSWLTLLETCYIAFTLNPHHQNFSKRLIKNPKLYFYDTGIACSLLGIESAQQLSTHYLRGNLFESFIIADLFKYFYNQAKRPPLYFWRDKAGLEVDCIVEQNQSLIPIEIKSGLTINPSFFDGLTKWNALAQLPTSNGYVIYSGSENQQRTKGNLISWQNLSSLFS